ALASWPSRHGPRVMALASWPATAWPATALPTGPDPSPWDNPYAPTAQRAQNLDSTIPLTKSRYTPEFTRL
ncbi:MAG: hypothetical protein P4L81_03540, partial [Candidatus Pacebacteria bacterium]|nr:hypothetical protein [Candidatus Paceibacterota bacterium]